MSPTLRELEKQLYPENAIQVDCTVRMNFDEMRKWSPAQMKAFLDGLVAVVSAAPDTGRDAT